MVGTRLEIEMISFRNNSWYFTGWKENPKKKEAELKSRFRRGKNKKNLIDQG